MYYAACAGRITPLQSPKPTPLFAQFLPHHAVKVISSPSCTYFLTVPSGLTIVFLPFSVLSTKEQQVSHCCTMHMVSYLSTLQALGQCLPAQSWCPFLSDPPTSLVPPRGFGTRPTIHQQGPNPTIGWRIRTICLKVQYVLANSVFAT